MFFLARFDAVIFDWNGTLLDDFWLMTRAMQEIFRHYGVVPPSSETYREEMNAASAADILKFYHDRGVPSRITLAEMNEIWHRVMREHWREAKLFIGVREVLEECGKVGAFCGLVSAEKKEFLAERLRMFEIEKHFQSVEGDAYNKRAALEIMLARAGTAPDRAVYVGDTEADIRHAQAAGMKTVGIAGGYASAERIVRANPDLFVHTVAELLPSLFACQASQQIAAASVAERIMKNPLVIGIVGKPASGKDSLSRLLLEEIVRAKPDVSLVVRKFSDALGAVLDARGVPRTTATLQALAQELVRKEGDGAVMRLMREFVKKEILSHDVVVLNGLRWREDLDMLRGFPRNVLIFIFADENARFARKSARRERADDTTLTLARFCKEDNAPTEQFIDQMGATAEVKVDNGGTEEELRAQVKGIVSRYV